MNIRDLVAATYFLRRVVPGKLDEELLIRTVLALEAEIRDRQNDDRQR